MSSMRLLVKDVKEIQVEIIRKNKRRFESKKSHWIYLVKLVGTVHHTLIFHRHSDLFDALYP